MVIRVTPRTKPIKGGDNTHHHDQSMTLDSFNPIKRMVNIPVKPIPLEFLVLLIFFCF